jgi:CheY-like chemotaxis protein
MRVLVVDDESSVRHVICRFLRLDFDAETVEASDGAKALELLLTERVHLVMLDLTMPIMDGLETLEAIRRSPAHADLPVLLMTAHADEQRVRRAVELNILDLLVKPFTQEVLRERVSKAVHPTRGTGGAAPRPSVIEVEPRRPLLVVDQSAEFCGIAAGPLRRLGSVETMQNEFAALSRCLDTRQALVVVGATSDLFSPELFARKVRAAPAAGDTRLMLASTDVAQGALFDAVVVRSFDPETFEASLMAAFGRTTRARLALHPEAPGVVAAVERLRAELARGLGADVTLGPWGAATLPEARWVLSAVELHSAHLAWEFRLKVPLPMAQAMARARHGDTADTVSEAQAGECVGRLVAETTAHLRATVGRHNVTLDLLAPRTTVTTPLVPRLPGGDPVALHRWLLSSAHGPVVATLSQYSADAHHA